MHTGCTQGSGNIFRYGDGSHWFRAHGIYRQLQGLLRDLAKAYWGDGRLNVSANYGQEVGD